MLLKLTPLPFTYIFLLQNARHEKITPYTGALVHGRKSTILFSAQVMSQFPQGFSAGNLPGFAAAAAANFANFRPQYSVPGQPPTGFPS